MPKALERYGRAQKTSHVRPLYNSMRMRAAYVYKALMLRIERKAAISSILEEAALRIAGEGIAHK